MVPINLNSLEQKFICSYDFIKIDNTFLKTTRERERKSRKDSQHFAVMTTEKHDYLKNSLKNFKKVTLLQNNDNLFWTDRHIYKQTSYS